MAKEKKYVDVGDRVRFSTDFLRNTGQYAGRVPWLRGTVTGVILPMSNGMEILHVEWDDGTWGRVLNVNLEPENAVVLN